MMVVVLHKLICTNLHICNFLQIVTAVIFIRILEGEPQGTCRLRLCNPQSSVHSTGSGPI